MSPISPELQAKRDALQQRLESAGRLLVAFSGGVDSSYLAWAARQALGDDALAVTAVSPSYPADHRAMAERVVAEFAIPHRFITTHEMESEAYRRNAPDRCYHCKTELYSLAIAHARELGMGQVVDGCNLDDLGDHRPGARHRGAPASRADPHRKGSGGNR